jgi:hypothetical protein
MGKDAITGFVTILTAVVAVAIVAVLVSKNSDTGNVLTAAGNALSGAIKAAVSPVVNAGANTELGHN